MTINNYWLVGAANPGQSFNRNASHNRNNGHNHSTAATNKSKNQDIPSTLNWG